MKKLLTAILIVFGSVAHGAVIFPITSLSEYIGNFPTNYNQSISNLNAAIAAGGVAQSPFTNDLDAAGNSIENLDAPEITNTTIFIRLWGTNVLALQGTTNVALNGVSLKDGVGTSTPQGPWTNAVDFNGFAGSGGNFIQLTNQTAIRVGTNLLAVQGWPDATNLAWNGQSLINAAGSTTDWKTRGITNSHEGWLVYQQEVATNALSQNTWTKYLIAGCAASNTIYDTGTNYGFAAGFLDETNHTFQAPVGWFSLYGRLHDGINPVTAGARDLQLYANGQPMTNINQSIYTADPAPGWPAIAGRTVAGTLYSEGGQGNFADMWQFNYAHYNASRTNIYSVYIRVGANAGLNAYTFMFRMVYEGDPR